MSIWVRWKRSTSKPVICVVYSENVSEFFRKTEENHGVLKTGEHLGMLLFYVLFFSPWNICDALCDMLPFAQFEERERHPWRNVTFRFRF